ncbi:MAG: glycoside hydrolase family 92 protein, partial [Clostridia bacterium]|nr:glycoside hydrolase family 92 protein [Clostridia bacterium]
DFGDTPETRGGLTRYMTLGYVAGDETRESVSRTLDFGLQDLAAAVLAEATGHDEDAAYFRARSFNYRNLWHPDSLQFLPRAADGSWLAQQKKDYCECTPRTAVWCVPYDVPGLCGLLAISPGAELAVPSACDLATFVRSRFFLLREKDAAAIERATAQMGGARLERVGTVLPDLVTFLEGRTVLWQRRKEDLVPHAVVCIEVGDDCDSFFRDGVQAALTYYAFADLNIRSNLFFHFPEELILPQLLTAELAVFDALSVYPVYAQPVRFAPGGTVSLVVPRIYPYAGDKVMALRPKTDENHILLPEELKKLRKYLASAMESGIIKGVLPLKKNTPAMLKKLSGDSLVFTVEKELPTGFAVLAVVPQDADVPGIGIGSFQPKYD